MCSNNTASLDLVKFTLIRYPVTLVIIVDFVFKRSNRKLGKDDFPIRTGHVYGLSIRKDNNKAL